MMIDTSLEQDITEIVAVGTVLAPLDSASVSPRHALTECRNCNANINGPYCHSCGQKAAHLHKPIWELAEDMLHSVLHWDGRLGLTLRQLFLRPGRMTLDWVNGQQVRYVPPIRLFIFISLLLVAVLAFSDVALVRVNSTVSPIDQTPMNCMIDAWHKNVKLMDYDCVDENDQTKKIKTININGTNTELFFLSLIPKQLPLNNLIEDSDIKTKNEDKKSIDFVKKVQEIVNEINRNPKVANDLISHSITRFMIIAVPLMAIILKLFYIRRKKYLVEHILFSLHVHTFFFLGLLICLVLAWISRGIIGGGQLLGILWFIYSLHFLFAQKKFYAQGWTRTILKSVVITGLYILGLITSATLAIMLSIGKLNIEF